MKIIPTSGRWRSARAFTLIELLVVISIIALLLSLLLPALSGARRSGRAVLCETHLRALGQAMQMYADYFNDTVPLGESDMADGSMHYAAALLPIIVGESANQAGPFGGVGSVTAAEAEFIRKLGRQEAFQCPDFPKAEQNLDYVVNAFSQPFASNANPGTPGTAPGSQAAGPDGRRLFANLTRNKKDASSLIYLTEAHAEHSATTIQLHDLFLSSQLPFGSFPRIASDLRHPSGINALFFDTHVERMTLQRLDPGPSESLAVRLQWFTIYKPTS